MTNMFTFLSISAALVFRFTAAFPTADSCDITASLMPCLVPFIEFLQEPDGIQFQTVLKSGHIEDVSSSQFDSVCRLSQHLVTCLGDFFTRCMPIGDIPLLISGTEKLMEVCDKPDVYSKFKLLSSCGKSLNSSANSPNYMACMDTAKNTVPYLRTANQAAAMSALQSGTLVRDLCCVMKSTNTCLAPQYSQCTPEALSLNKDVYDAVMSAYDCNAKMQDGCPVASSSTPDMDTMLSAINTLPKF